MNKYINQNILIVTKTTSFYIILMNSSHQISIRQAAFHKLIRSQYHLNSLNKDRQQFQSHINKNLLKQTIQNLNQQSMNQLTDYLKVWKEGFEISEIEADSIVTFLNHLNYVPYNFLIALFQKITQSSQRRLIQAGVGNIAIFISIESLIVDPEMFRSYLIFISKIQKPSKIIKQYFFSQKIIPNIFLENLYLEFQEQLSIVFLWLTKANKSVCNQDPFYSDFIDSLKFIIEFVDNDTQSHGILLQALRNIAKYKDPCILQKYLASGLLQKCINIFKRPSTVQKAEKLIYLIGSIYQNYPNYIKVSQQNRQVLLEYYSRFLQYFIAFIESGKCPYKSRIQIYFTIYNLIFIPQYQKIILNKQIFTFVCDRVEYQALEKQQILDEILNCLISLIQRLDTQYLLSFVHDARLINKLFQISYCNQWNPSLRGNTLQILERLLEIKEIRLQFRRIPYSQNKLEEIKMNFPESHLVQVIQNIENLLDNQNDQQRNSQQ